MTLKKTFRLPKPFAEKWLEALRSGEYTQYQGTLVNYTADEEENIDWCSDVEACCLGVAALMCGANPRDLAGEDIPSDLDGKLLSVLEYPDELLENSMNENYNFSNILAALNDGMTDTYFESIKSLYPNIIFHKDEFEKKFDLGMFSSKLTYSFEDIAKFVEDNTEFYDNEL